MNSHESEPDAIVSEAELRLEDVDPGPFSPQAFRVLKIRVSDYVRVLVLESARVARRRREDVISASHVEQASDHLVANSAGRWLRHPGTIGGILLGAALSNFLAMASSGQYSATGVLVSATLGMAGAFGVAFHIGME